jgi:hypothetical protein
VEDGDVSKHLHPIGHIHGQLLRKKAIFLFISSQDKFKTLEKAKLENAAHSQENAV